MLHLKKNAWKRGYTWLEDGGQILDYYDKVGDVVIIMCIISDLRFFNAAIPSEKDQLQD